MSQSDLVSSNSYQRLEVRVPCSEKQFFLVQIYMSSVVFRENQALVSVTYMFVTPLYFGASRESCRAFRKKYDL